MTYIQVGGWTVSGTFGNGSACDDDNGKGIIEVEPCHFSCSGRDEVYGTSQVGGVLAWMNPKSWGCRAAFYSVLTDLATPLLATPLTTAPHLPRVLLHTKYPSSQQRGEIEELRN